MNSDIKIIIAAHKPFKCPVSSDSYHIVTTCQDDSTEYPVEKSIAKDLDVPADKPFYGELYQMYWAVKNITLPKYTGLCHYRRYFTFLDSISCTEKKLKENNTVVTSYPVILPYTMYEHYMTYHNIEDLDICRDIIREKYPQFTNAFDTAMKWTILYPCNICIMPSDMFKEYTEMVMDILNIFLERIGGEYAIEGRIECNLDKYSNPTIAPENLVSYQKRLGGFLAERLFNVFILGKDVRVTPSPIKYL